MQNHASKLQETRAALEEEMARREDLSRRLLRLQDEERQRIAGELHDSTAQNLAALAMLMGRLQKSERQLPAPMRASLTEGAELVQAVMREVRTVSYLLHPPLLEDVGLITALRGYVEGFCRRSGIRVDLDLAGDIGRVPLPVKTAVFRIMQECLNNVHRHSGSSNACVRLSRKGRALTLQVEDSGRGFPRGALNTDGDPVAHMGVGISAIQERLRQINGTLQIRSRRKKTLVIATVPLDRPVGGNGAPLRS